MPSHPVQLKDGKGERLRNASKKKVGTALWGTEIKRRGRERGERERKRERQRDRQKEREGKEKGEEEGRE